VSAIPLATFGANGIALNILNVVSYIKNITNINNINETPSYKEFKQGLRTALSRL